MTVRINKQKINLREKLTEFEDKVNFDEVVRGLGEYTGNVGIGTTSPGYKLDIQGDSNQASRITLTRTDVGRTAVLSANSDSPACPFVGSQSNNDFAIHTNGSAKMLIDTDGNVGIGTTSPSAKLHLKTTHSDTNAIDNLLILEAVERADQDLSPGDGLGILFKVPVGNNETSAVGARIAAVKEGGTENATSTELVFEVSQQDETLDEAMRIDRDGNVGIGTTDPGNKAGGESSINPIQNVGGKLLHVENDSGNTTLVLGSSTQPSIMFAEGDALAGERYKTFRISGGKSQFLNLNDDGQIGNIALSIETDGYIGIGTTDPGVNKLYVNGNIYASGTITPSSDDRVKHNEQNIVGAIETLGKLTPKKYIKTTEMYEADHNFELDEDGNPVDANGEPVEHTVEAGVIAQQVLTVDELAFAVSPEGVDEDGNATSPHGLNYNSLFTYAIAAIQEQQQIIEDLKSRIETLESK